MKKIMGVLLLSTLALTGCSKEASLKNEVSPTPVTESTVTPVVENIEWNANNEFITNNSIFSLLFFEQDYVSTDVQLSALDNTEEELQSIHTFIESVKDRGNFKIVDNHIGYNEKMISQISTLEDSYSNQYTLVSEFDIQTQEQRVTELAKVSEETSDQLNADFELTNWKSSELTPVYYETSGVISTGNTKVIKALDAKIQETGLASDMLWFAMDGVYAPKVELEDVTGTYESAK